MCADFSPDDTYSQISSPTFARDLTAKKRAFFEHGTSGLSTNPLII